MNSVVIGQFSAVRRAARAVEKLRKSCISDRCLRTVVLDKPACKSGFHASRSSRQGRGSVFASVGDDERRSPDRPAGILVTVEAPTRVSRELAVKVLSELGASIVESRSECSGRDRDLVRCVEQKERLEDQ